MTNILTGATTPPLVNSNATSSTSFNNPNYGPAQNAFLQNLGNTPTQFKQFQGALNAPINPNMTGAANNASSLASAWNPTAAQAGNYYSAMPGVGTQQGGLSNQYASMGVNAAFNPANSWANQSSNWMSPYMGDVVQQIANAGNQNFNTQLMPSINSQFIGSGDFNSLANMGGLAQGAGLAQQGITSAQANALNQGYTTGMQGYLQQLAQQTGSANNAAGAANQTGYMQNYGLSGAGSGAAGLGTSGVNNMMGTGNSLYTAGLNGVNNAINQSNLWNQYNLQYPTAVGGALNGMQNPMTTTGSSNAPLAGATYGASPLNQALGALNTFGTGVNTVSNAYNQWFGPNNTSTPDPNNPGYTVPINSSYSNYAPGTDVTVPAPVDTSGGGLSYP